MSVACGIDIGGSGIKGALVDLTTGELVSERVRIETPYPATPEAVAKTAVAVAEAVGATPDTPIGVSLPAPVPQGLITFMANLDPSWVGHNAREVFADAFGRSVTVLNDADAAGLAEVAFGAARGNDGVVLVTTLGTGIGTALVNRGVLVPNTELGHIEIRGVDAETEASAAVRTRENLDWEQWAARLQRYYSTMELLLSPDLIVVGGGVSKKSDRFFPLLNLRTPLVPAELRNLAGIVGAAAAAAAE